MVEDDWREEIGFMRAGGVGQDFFFGLAWITDVWRRLFDVLVPIPLDGSGLEKRARV